MIRVMVVEDEPPIQKSICMLLEEYDDTLQVVHTAINGRRALEYLEENPVDLIFTDVKMPVMSGLELAREVHQRFPGITMVIISGFSEFEFARTAIQYGVREYLLKPISREQIQELLSGLFADVRRRETEQLRAALRQMVLGGQPELKGLPGGPYGLLLYCEGAFPLAPDELPGQNRLVWEAPAVERELRHQLAPADEAVVVLGRSVVEKLVLFSAENAAQVRQLAWWLFGFLTRQSKIPITMVVHPQLVRLNAAAEPLAALRGQLHHSVCLFHSAIVDGSGPPAPAEGDAAEWSKTMVTALKTKDGGAIRAACGELAGMLQHHPVRQAQLVVMLEKLVLNCFGEVLNLRQMESLKQELQALVSRADMPEEFSAELYELLEAWTADGADGEEEDFCEAVAAWLRLNHARSISNADLAAQFRCPAARLSKQFKSHFGVSVSEYVNQFRVELAQTMMREDKKARIKEIALDVGFSDQYYFSKIFKKVTGVWPTEYSQE